MRINKQLDRMTYSSSSSYGTRKSYSYIGGAYRRGNYISKTCERVGNRHPDTYVPETNYQYIDGKLSTMERWGA